MSVDLIERVQSRHGMVIEHPLDLFQLTPPDEGIWDVSLSSEVLSGLEENHGEMLKKFAMRLNAENELLLIRSIGPVPEAIIVPYWDKSPKTDEFWLNIGKAVVATTYMILNQGMEIPHFYVHDISQALFLFPTSERECSHIPEYCKGCERYFHAFSPLEFMSRPRPERFLIQLFGKKGHWIVGRDLVRFEPSSLSDDSGE